VEIMDLALSEDTVSVIKTLSDISTQKIPVVLTLVQTSYNASTGIHKNHSETKTPLKKERSELEKIQRSFKRQATWFLILSLISGFIGAGIFDLDSLLSASPFFILTLIGLTAFVLATRFMIKTKRISKKNEALSEEDKDSRTPPLYEKGWVLEPHGRSGNRNHITCAFVPLVLGFIA